MSASFRFNPPCTIVLPLPGVGGVRFEPVMDRALRRQRALRAEQEMSQRARSGTTAQQRGRQQEQQRKPQTPKKRPPSAEGERTKRLKLVVKQEANMVRNYLNYAV